MVKKYVLTRQSQDLTLMRKAILQGISEYHTKKMALVNRLLDRYWRNIYCGNDIISIYISCEQATTGANQGKYSYKIMAKRKIGDTGSSVECFGNHNREWHPRGSPRAEHFEILACAGPRGRPRCWRCRGWRSRRCPAAGSSSASVPRARRSSRASTA